MANVTDRETVEWIILLTIAKNMGITKEEISLLLKTSNDRIH